MKHLAAAVLGLLLLPALGAALTGDPGGHKHKVKVVIPKDGDSACAGSDVLVHVETSQCREPQKSPAPAPRPSASASGRR